MESPRALSVARYNRQRMQTKNPFQEELQQVCGSMCKSRDLTKLDTLGTQHVYAPCTNVTDTITVGLHNDPRFIAIREKWLARENEGASVPTNTRSWLSWLFSWSGTDN